MHLSEAMRICGQIKPRDITALSKKPEVRDIVRLTFDTINILLMLPLVPVQPHVIEFGDDLAFSGGE